MTAAPGDKQTIGELIVLAQLEPALHIVLVEGRHDAAFFSWYLDQHGIAATVNAISDRLFVPRSEISPDSEIYGEREKLVTVVTAVNVALGLTQRAVTAIVDADWSLAVGPVPVSLGCLLFTDYPSLEGYFLESAALDRFVRLSLGLENVEVSTVVSALAPALLDLASARLVLESSNVSCVSGFASLCVVTGPTPGADVREILARSFNGIPKSQWPADLDEMVGWADGYRDLLASSGHMGRGHDIAPLLIVHFGLKNELAVPLTIERLMRSTVRTPELDSHPLFVNLRKRLAA